MKQRAENWFKRAFPHRHKARRTQRVMHSRYDVCKCRAWRLDDGEWRGYWNGPLPKETP